MDKILIIFGSKSDKETFSEIIKELKSKDVEYELRICSAHRTPDFLNAVLKSDAKIILAGAGLAAHLPGVVASKTIRPIIGIPCHGNYQGLDALLSIMQMPPGIPVMGVGVNKGAIAAKEAVKMLKGYDTVTIVGDKELAKKATDMLDSFDVRYTFADKPDANSVNIEFTQLDEEPTEKEDELVIYVPTIKKGDDSAEASLNILNHSSHGLWVGLNRGDNAAIAAVQILNVEGGYNDQLNKHREEQKEKVIKDDEETIKFLEE